jgi:capsular exopolysaccharide synthesis family protein
MANPTATSRKTSSSTRHLTDYLRVLYKRRWAAIPGFLLVFLTGAIGSLRTVPVYEATTQIVIQKDAKRATSVDQVLQDRDSWYDDDFYPTQYRILQSRALAARTASALAKTFRPEVVPPNAGASFSLSALVGGGISHLTALFARKPVTTAAPAGAAPSMGANAEAAESAATDRILGGLTVTPIRNSEIVQISFRSPDPEFASAAANALATQYIQQNLEFREQATSQTNAWLTRSLAEQKQLVEESDAKLQAYKEDHNAVSVDDKQNIVVQKLNTTNAQLLEAKNDRIGKEVAYRALLDLEQKGEPLDAFPTIMQDPVLQKMRADIVAKEGERSKMSTTYGPRYAGMAEITKEIDAAKADYNAQVQKAATAIRTDYMTAKAKEDSLQETLNEQQQQSYGLDKKMIDYSELDREAKSNREIYETLLAKSKESGTAADYRGTSIQVLDKAEVPQAPVLPQTRRDLMLSSFGGLLLALGLAFGFEYFDSRIKAPDEIKTHLNLPFLGMIPVVPGAKDQGGEAPMLRADVPPAFAEAMRAIRTGLLFSSADEGGRTVVITSTGPHEGKTVVSSSLAITLAQAGQRTLVIDADMRRPRMHEALGCAQEPGLSNVLVGDTSLADATRATSVANLSLLAAGHIPPNPAELLGSKKYLDLMANLKSRYDWVLIDAPPVMPVTDAAIVANTAGGVIFVIGAEMTPRQTAATAIEQLRGANAKFIGAVLNRVNVTRHSYYYAPYYRKEYAKYYQRSGSQA